MVDKRKILKWAGILFLVWLFFDFFKTIINGPVKVIVHDSNIPAPDPNKTPFEFDFYSGKWVYKEDMARDNDLERTTRKQREAEMQEYMENHIDGYKEKTYWGEQWDADDWDDDDKHEDWDDMRKK